MPSIEKFSAWIDSEGERLREYCIEYDSQTKTKTCWIPSQAKERFKVYCQDDGRRFITAYDIQLDGQTLPYCLTIEPRYDPAEPVCFDGVDTPHGLAPFVFSPCIFVDEDTPNVSMRVDSQIGTIKVDVYKARVVKDKKKKKKTNTKEKKEKKTTGKKKNGPVPASAPEPANAPGPAHTANTIGSVTHEPGSEPLFPELILNERKKLIGLEHGIQLGEVQRPNNSPRPSMATSPVPTSAATNPSMPIALNPVSTAEPGGSRLERREPVSEERQEDPEESDLDGYAVNYHQKVATFIFKYRPMKFLITDKYVLRELHIPRVRSPSLERIEDRSLTPATLGTTTVKIEDDMADAAANPASLDPMSDLRDFPELEMKVQLVAEMQAILSQPDRMPVPPDPAKVIDLTLDSDDDKSDDEKKRDTTVLLANAQEKMQVLQSQMSELQRVIESVTVTQKRPTADKNDTVPIKRVKLEPKDAPMNPGVVPEKEIKREE